MQYMYLFLQKVYYKQQTLNMDVIIALLSIIIGLRTVI